MKFSERLSLLHSKVKSDHDCEVERDFPDVDSDIVAGVADAC